MLLGEYRLNLDAGWLTLPLSIRHALHELYAPDDTTLIASTFDEWCLALYPRDAWLTFEERLHRAGESCELIRYFRTSALVCPVDREGRVYLPLAFRQHAAIEREVLLIGFFIRLELWSPQQWEEYEANERWWTSSPA